MPFNTPYGILGWVLAVINITGFIITGLDKYRAKKKMWRIRESTFFLLSLLGGCPGVYIGLLLFRHKTRHWYFMLGIPAIFAVQLLAVFYLLFRH